MIKPMNYIEGKVIFQRSDSDKCVCCDGNHIFSRGIEIEPYPSVYRGLNVETVSDFIHETISTTKNIENKKVRISIEVLD